MGNYIYLSDLMTINLPESIDSGALPFLGFYLALFWKIFGRELWVSHFAILPIIFGIFVQLFHFVSFYVTQAHKQIAAFVLILITPIVGAHFFHVNTEIFVLFFFFWAVNSILYKNEKQLVLALLLLGLVSYRGMMLCAGIFLFDLLNHSFVLNQRVILFINLRKIASYLLGSIPAVVFIIWRLIEKGWLLQTTEGTAYGEAWHMASLGRIFFNIIVLIRWYTDFGQLFVILLIFFIFLKNPTIIREQHVKQLFLLSVSSVIFVIFVSIFSKNPFGSRYFIVSFVSVILLAFTLIEKIRFNKKRVFALLMIGMLSGSFWIYPEKLSHNWDCTPAHLPYFSLRKDAIDYLDKNNIAIEKTATFFPNYGRIDDVDQSGDLREFPKFNGTNEYVLYSNVFNLTDEEFSLLEKDYIPVQQIYRLWIKFVIYKKIE
jgi:hypothetical protein